MTNKHGVGTVSLCKPNPVKQEAAHASAAPAAGSAFKVVSHSVTDGIGSVAVAVAVAAAIIVAVMVLAIRQLGRKSRRARLADRRLARRTNRSPPRVPATF